MAPETAPLHGGVTPALRRLRGSNLLLAGALVTATTAGTLWVTGALGAHAAAAPVNAPATTVHADAAATPVPAATPTAGVKAAAAAAPVQVQTGPPNILVSADGTLNTTVTTYSDCTGQSELTHAAAAVDTCVSGRTYFVGHNAGVFTPLLNLGVGDIITWDDGSGVVHRLRIVAMRDNWLRADGVPPLASPDVVAQFQTCETAYPDGSHDRILDAVPAQ